MPTQHSMAPLSLSITYPYKSNFFSKLGGLKCQHFLNLSYAFLLNFVRQQNNFKILVRLSI